MKLEDVVTVKIGRNLSRGNEKNNLNVVAYSYEDLIQDLDGSFLDSKANEYSGNSNDENGYLSHAGRGCFQLCKF